MCIRSGVTGRLRPKLLHDAIDRLPLQHLLQGHASITEHAGAAQRLLWKDLQTGGQQMPYGKQPTRGMRGWLPTEKELASASL